VIYQAHDETVVIHIPTSVNRIGIMLSGGLDSTLLLYMLCKEIWESQQLVTIKPITWKRPYPLDFPQDWNVAKAQHIINIIQNIFPNIIEPQYVFIPKFSSAPLSATEEENEWNRIHKIGREQFGIDTYYYGVTANPPRLEMEKFGMMEGRQQHRDKELMNPARYTDPFNNLDKQGIAALYHELGLMEKLFPSTWSCEGWANSTNNFKVPCEKCWWCKEKHWGFGEF